MLKLKIKLLLCTYYFFNLFIVFQNYWILQCLFSKFILTTIFHFFLIIIFFNFPPFDRINMFSFFIITLFFINILFTHFISIFIKIYRDILNFYTLINLYYLYVNPILFFIFILFILHFSNFSLFLFIDFSHLTISYYLNNFFKNLCLLISLFLITPFI